MSEIHPSLKAAIDEAIANCPPDHKVVVAFEPTGVRISLRPKEE